MYLKYINWFRGIAIIFVAFSHCIRLVSWDNSSWQKEFFQAFFIEGTTLFVFISGYLFEHLKSKYELKKYFISKWKNVIIPYLIISIPAILIYVGGFKDSHEWILTDEFVSKPKILQVIIFYLTGAHLGPLWYIPMACLLFAISPLMLTMVKRNFLVYLIVPLFCVAWFIPKPHMNSSVPQAFLHYLFVYAFGMYLSNKKEVVNLKLRTLSFRILAPFIFCVLLAATYLGYNNAMFLQKIVLCILSIQIFLILEDKRKELNWLNKLAKGSFGIYFIHGYLIAALAMFLPKFPFIVQGATMYLLICSAVLILSYLLVIACQFLFGKKSRFLIGC